jgi:hypothetical protein
MIGSEQPLEFSAATLDAFVHSEPDVEADLDRIGIDSGSDLLARYQMDRQQMLALAKGVERNTDDNMRIEYSAPLHLYDDTAENNFRALFAPVRPSSGASPASRTDRLAKSTGEQDWINALWTSRTRIVWSEQPSVPSYAEYQGT